MTKDRQYIASLIDKINIDFIYTLNASESLEIDYTYHIDGEITVTEKNNPSKVLLVKKEKILEPVTKKTTKKLLLIEEIIDIDYEKYNQLITSFKSDYVLSTDSMLTITLYLDFIGNSDNINSEIKDQNKMSVNIPLSEQTINIDIDYEEVDDYYVVENVGHDARKTVTFFGLALVCLLIDLALVVKAVRLNANYRKNRTKYVIELKRIMKEYDRVIVKTISMPPLDDLKIVEVESFEEMLDARDNTEKSILYFEVIKNHESIFFIINGDVVFLYVLNDDKKLN